jgi:hypothetical protein
MSTLFTFLFVLLVSFATTAQSLVLKGRVRCVNQHVNSTRGAENIVIVPTFIPVKSTVTGSAPPGYFEINTGILYEDLQDKQVHLYIISKCTQCRQIAKRVFISEDRDRKNRDPQKVYVTVREWKLDGTCSDAELSAYKADSLLAVVIKQPAVNIKDLSAATAVVGAPPLMNLLTTLAAVPAVAAVGELKANTMAESQMTYGNFLFSSPVSLSSNTGFNFSPSRNLSEAMFWNPSAIVHSPQPHNISLFTNARNNLKFGGYVGLTSTIALGAGVLYTKQSETRRIAYGLDFDPDRIQDDNVQHRMKLDEYAVFVAPSFKINEKFSAAITGKLIAQQFNAPDLLHRTDPDRDPVFEDSTVRNRKFDVDISLSYKVNGALQVGLNLMNLAGTELFADAFTVYEKKLVFNRLRAGGLGLTYKWRRFHFGSDILFTQDGFYDAAIGVNYIPFNYALISAGVALKQLSYSASFELKNFRISYVDDNKALFYEARRAKVNIFDGRLYTGFTFKF